MNSDDAFERCLESLYEAALDDARWPAASPLIDEDCGVRGSCLVVGKALDVLRDGREVNQSRARQDPDRRIPRR